VIGSSALFRIAAAAAGEARNSMNCFASAALAAAAPTPAAITETRWTSGGSGPTRSMPGTGTSSLIC
jgi:hypothetical protein